MRSKLEEMIGQIEQGPIIPGTGKVSAEKFRYVNFNEPESPADLFLEIAWKIKPPIPGQGGVNLPPCILTIPDGSKFFALEFFADLSGWQRQIENGASASGRVSAKIETARFVISDGRSFDFSECKVDFVDKFMPRKEIHKKRSRESH